MPKQRTEIIGYCGVDSGQILLTDPCYLKSWEDNECDFDHPERRDFSYAGACNASCDKEKSGGQLFNYDFLDDIGAEVGVCVSSGYGDGVYPVTATYDKDGRVESVTIKFL